MNDTGDWALQIKHEVRRRGISVHVETISYYGIGPLRFLLRMSQSSTNSRVKRHINEVLRIYPNASHSIVAFSNGTKIISDIKDDINVAGIRGGILDIIIFCGSVCKREKMPRKGVNARIVVNDYSPKDVWPVVAEALNPFSFDATGTYGCKGPGIEDRAISVDHSGWTTYDYFSKFVVPIISANYFQIGETPTRLIPYRYVYIIRFVASTILILITWLIIWAVTTLI